MHNFLLFFGRFYYPGGGADDLVDSFEKFEQAQEAASNKFKEKIHITILKMFQVMK